MSGQYNSRNFLRCKSQHASEITFGDVFQSAGYATGIFGKWKQTRGTREIPAKDYIFEFGWDEFCCFDVVGEGQRFINPNLVINGEVHVPVTGLRLTRIEPPIKVGAAIKLRHQVVPADATRRNVIWESSDPTVASINKFGELTAHAPGTVEIRIYSWDDANPLSANERETFSRKGIQDAMRIEVQP